MKKTFRKFYFHSVCVCVCFFWIKFFSFEFYLIDWFALIISSIILKIPNFWFFGIDFKFATLKVKANQLEKPNDEWEFNFGKNSNFLFWLDQWNFFNFIFEKNFAIIWMDEILVCVYVFAVICILCACVIKLKWWDHATWWWW